MSGERAGHFGRERDQPNASCRGILAPPEVLDGGAA